MKFSDTMPPRSFGSGFLQPRIGHGDMQEFDARRQFFTELKDPLQPSDWT
jgi:hypothetical protein